MPHSFRGKWNQGFTKPPRPGLQRSLVNGKWMAHASLVSTHVPNMQKAKRGTGTHYFYTLIFEKKLFHTSLSSFIDKEYFSQVLLQPLHTRQALKLHQNGECSCLVAGTSYTDQLPTSGKRLSRCTKEKSFFFQSFKAANQRIFLSVQQNFYWAASELF